MAIDLVSAGAPLLNLRGVTDVRQPAAAQPQAPGMLGNLLAGASVPESQQEQMRRQIGGLFGIDTRSPAEQFRDRLLQSNIDTNTSEGVAQAVQIAKELNMPSLASELTEQQREMERTNEALGANRAFKAMYFQDLADSVEDEGLKSFLTNRVPAILGGQFDDMSQEDLDKLVNNAYKNFGQEFKDVPDISEEEAVRAVDILASQFPGQEELFSNPVVLDQIWTIKNRYKKELSWAEAAQVFMQRYSANLEDAFANLSEGGNIPRGLDAGSSRAGRQPAGTAITPPSVQSYQEGARAALGNLPPVDKRFEYNPNSFLNRLLRP